MQISAKHHHTPAFYLRRWTDSDGKLYVIRNINGDIKRKKRTPGSTGFEYNLYSYDDACEAEDRSEIETNFFKPLDNNASQVVAKFLDKKPPSEREVRSWAQFLAAMRVRTPENIARIQSQWEERLRSEAAARQSDYDRLKKDTDPENILEWLKIEHPGFVESYGTGQVPKIASDERIIRDIMSMDWHTIDFTTSSKSLLSSDRPCVYVRSLSDPDALIVLPLSPHCAFIAFRSGSAMEDALLHGPVSPLAATINQSVVSQATSRAYSQMRGDAPDSFFKRYLKMQQLS